MNKNDLIKKLNKATKAYDEGHPIMSDKEWDDLYFELSHIEESAGTASADSPTQIISYEVVNELEKIDHEHPMLSLPKTKSLEELENFIGDHDYIVMPKLDGLTCSLTYENGELIRAETRGDGNIGENILHNAKVIRSIPKHINYKQRLVVDGEIICTYKDFKDFANDYKNPRNFAAGSIRLLDSRECAKRKLIFIVWDIIEGFEEKDYLHDKLELIYEQGFISVDYTAYWGDLQEDIDHILEWNKKWQYPIDGIVVKYESKKLRQSLPATSHHLGGAIAYKFYDEEYESRLKSIEWTMGRTGVLTPVAIFDSIEVDGTIIERASLHNVSVMRETLGECAYVGEPITVIKSNQIIPQIIKAGPKHNYGEVIAAGGVSAHDVLEKCPICGGEVEIRTSDVSDTQLMICMNPLCSGKLINQIDHYCGKKGLDIKGLSKKTIEKLIDWEWLTKIRDLYTLKDHRDEWIQKDGFGSTSVDKILNSIKENSQNVKLEDFISAIGIPLIGKSVSLELVKHIKTYNEFRDKIKNHFDFSEYDNIAENKSDYIYNFDYTEADYIVEKEYVMFSSETEINPMTGCQQTLKDKAVVITGKLEFYKNRDEMAKDIVNHGGKIAGSVSRNTHILINNNIESTSSKNKKAKELNIPIMSEEEFRQKYLT